MNRIVRILIQRDGMSTAEALEALADAQERVTDGEDPEEVLHDDFGLEPDYLFDLIG